MSNPHALMSDAETTFADECLQRIQLELLEQFPDRGQHVFIVLTLACVARLFHTLEEEDRLADILNLILEAHGTAFRMVRVS